MEKKNAGYQLLARTEFGRQGTTNEIRHKKKIGYQ